MIVYRDYAADFARERVTSELQQTEIVTVVYREDVEADDVRSEVRGADGSETNAGATRRATVAQPEPRR
jgi:hypothetical protein